MAEPFQFRWSTHKQDKDYQAKSTFHYVDWTALLEEARILNDGRSCVYDGHDEDYRNGGRHLARRIKFIDTGDLWIVRLPQLPYEVLPPCKTDKEMPGILAGMPKQVFSPAWWGAYRKWEMESEIATMIHIARTTEIPVPKIYGYNTSIVGNPAKLPYMFMQCIKGNILQDIGGSGAERRLEKDQRVKLKKAVAWIQFQLAAAPIDKIGSLVLGPNGTVDIGPLPAQFGWEGPFESAKDYFCSWGANAEHPNQAYVQDRRGSDQENKQNMREFPTRLKLTMEKKPPGSVPGYEKRFPIVHGGFSWHNMLFDDELNVVGVIDWEHTHSAPLEVFAINNNLYHYHREPHEYDIDAGEPYIEQIKGLEKDLEKNTGKVCKLSQAFGSILGDIGEVMASWDDWCQDGSGPALLDRYLAET